MSCNSAGQLELAEKILLEKFHREPFHNLYHLYNTSPITYDYGGTCSDKTLSYLSAITQAGIKGYLHSARIGGEEVHRLVRLKIEGCTYFADIGNGWPSIRLYPSHKPIEFHCFGMRYRTEIIDDVISVYHAKRGVEKLQMEIDIPPKCKEKIMQSIRNRFDKSITYPFSHSLRFSLIVNNRFLFLRDTQLEIYSTSGYEELPNIKRENLQQITSDHFDFNISPIIDQIGSGIFHSQNLSY